MENFLNIFLPQNCLHCGSFGDLLCAGCKKEIHVLNKEYFYSHDSKDFVAQPNENTFKVFSVFEYSSAIRSCIRKSKYPPKAFSVLRVLLKLAPKIENSILVPIPLSKHKMKVRGFNQADMIARLVKGSGTVVKEILYRTHDTKAQYENSREDRYTNLSGAFAVKRQLSGVGKQIVIIDDICTSGATLYEAYKSLNQAGYVQVRAYCLSKAVWDFERQSDRDSGVSVYSNPFV